MWSRSKRKVRPEGEGLLAAQPLRRQRLCFFYALGSFGRGFQTTETPPGNSVDGGGEEVGF